MDINNKTGITIINSKVIIISIRVDINRISIRVEITRISTKEATIRISTRVVIRITTKATNNSIIIKDNSNKWEITITREEDIEDSIPMVVVKVAVITTIVVVIKEIDNTIIRGITSSHLKMDNNKCISRRIKWEIK